MNKSDFTKIAAMLRIYPKCCADEYAVEIWFDSLKRYSFGEVYQAVKDYLNSSQYAPVPAQIIQLIPKGKSGLYKPMYRDGQRLIQCMRCRDTGLVTYCDDDGRVVGFPCDCPAGHDKYSWGWLTDGEREEHIRKNGSHGSSASEDWYKLNEQFAERYGA